MPERSPERVRSRQSISGRRRQALSDPFDLDDVLPAPCEPRADVAGGAIDEQDDRRFSMDGERGGQLPSENAREIG
jgi:hypothetical protein